MEAAADLSAFLTIAGTIFAAELTDKDALLLLTLATKMKSLVVFAAGSVAFTITTAVIVAFSSIIVAYVPIFWVKIGGGSVMLGYAALEYARGTRIEQGVEGREERLLGRARQSQTYVILGMIGSLVLLDLAGDATELVTIVFVAQYQNLILVFVSATIALVAASGVETLLGSRLGRLLSSKNIRILSIVIFLIIGSIVIGSTLIPALV